MRDSTNGEMLLQEAIECIKHGLTAMAYLVRCIGKGIGASCAEPW
jgi:hypothetical protein